MERRLLPQLPRSRLFSSSFVVLSLFLLSFSLRALLAGERFSTAFLAVTPEVTDADVEPARSFGLLDWLHYDVILASRKSYPVALMFGFNCYGNVLLRRECGDKPYPNWLFGFPLAFICYTYPGAVFSDLFFVSESPRAMSNDNIFFIFSFWFILIQNCEPVYKFFLRKHVFIVLTTWWLADATRASLCFLERAVSHQPVFARGMWQAFIWCAAGPVVRVAEAAIRGGKIPPLDRLQPNSLNAFKYPLVSMWMTMVSYLCYLTFLTDCNLFGKAEVRLTMVECGDKHEDLWAAFVYTACILHLARGYWGLYSGTVIFGETFCLGSCAK